MRLTIGELNASTWDAFAELVERNNGIFGGCWCIGFHLHARHQNPDHRAAKEEPVKTDRSHTALVFDEDGRAQGWCQYGSPEELPNIKHRRKCEQDAQARVDRGAQARSVVKVRWVEAQVARGACLRRASVAP